MAKVIPFPRSFGGPEDEDTPPRSEVQARVHELSKDLANIRFNHPHFQARLIERQLTMRQVLEALRKGLVIDGPTRDQWGDLGAKLRRKVAGRRVQIVVAVKEKHLDAVTVI